MRFSQTVFALLLLAGVALAAPGNFTIKRVTKAYNGKVYVHIMPWFETKETNGNGQWGIHWTMANRNPDIIDGNGRRQIAAHFYPDIEPYASGSDSLVDYQLGLIKAAGIDGIFIDWPGTVQAWDYPNNLRNSEALIRGTERVGLEFAIVYEDHNIGMSYDAGFINDKIAAAHGDMRYLQSNYFSKSNYVRFNGAPLLLDFGPQTFKSPNEWTQIFSVLSQKPSFFTLWYQQNEAGRENSVGEFCWIYQDYLPGLVHFCQYHTEPPNKIGGAYPGFVSYYAQGGWPGPNFEIPHGETFRETLNVFVNCAATPIIQLNTWNDYGEGTIIEPTKEFGNKYLLITQELIGVKGVGEKELNMVKEIYLLRQAHKDNPAKLEKLTEAYNHLIIELNTPAAELILSTL